MVNGNDVGSQIRTREVSNAVSAVAVIPQVRHVMVGMQQEIIAEAVAAGAGIVAEGRDIGTVVAPRAAVKVYLTASETARAKRRSADLADDPAATVATIQREQARRDRKDAGQMVMAADAVGDRHDRTGPRRGGGRDRRGWPGAGWRCPVAEPMPPGQPDRAVRPSRPRCWPSSAGPTSGKSTLVNRILGSRQAVVEDVPGVTRDRVTYDATWRGRAFTLVDTGGWEPSMEGTPVLAAQVAAQARVAVDAADADAVRGRRGRGSRPTPTPRSPRCCAGPASRWCSRPTRSTTRRASRRCTRSGRSAWASRCRSARCTAAAAVTCWTRSSTRCPRPRRTGTSPRAARAGSR